MKTEYPKPKETKQTILEELYDLRENYHNEIPEEIIHSTMGRRDNQYPDKNYKARKAWFCILEILLVRLIKNWGGLPQSLLEETKAYRRSLFSSEFHQKERVTREDIEKADTMINKIIAELEK